MPTLDWIGKDAVVGHHHKVPYRLLHCDPKLSAGDPDAGNLLVQGDNLEALKALLPYYGGQVKCIYIDPPYNTGNEGWVYNDNVNSPEIRQWLEQVVGKEGDDLSRHDKWLCMMYPRLMLLKEFLRDDGAIFVSIDDNEAQSCRVVMDEIFGRRNFIASVIWQKVFSPKNSARHFSDDHEYVIVFGKNADLWSPNLLPRSAEADKRYKNPDNDPRGPWTSGDLSARNFYSAGTYPVVSPTGRKLDGPPKGRYWAVSETEFNRLDRDNRIWWGKSGNNAPRLKRFLAEVKDGVVPQTIWSHSIAGNTQEAKKEILSVCDFETSQDVFVTPKPLRLIERVLSIGADKDSIIMDSFAGSGTTGHAVMHMNKRDGGSRRFIAIEIDDEIAGKVTAQRLTRASEGYYPGGDKSKEVIEGLGSGFRFCRLGKPLFDQHGCIDDEVTFADLARHVFFSETGSPIPKQPKKNNPLLGEFSGTAIYLLYNGVLGDKRPDGGNVLTHRVLDALPDHPSGEGPRVVYGEACRLSDKTLASLGIAFRQIPFELKVS